MRKATWLRWQDADVEKKIRQLEEEESRFPRSAAEFLGLSSRSFSHWGRGC